MFVSHEEIFIFLWMEFFKDIYEFLPYVQQSWNPITHVITHTQIIKKVEYIYICMCVCVCVGIQKA